MKCAFFTLLLTVTSLGLFAQGRTITGTVKARGTKQALAFCNIYILPKAIGTHTDSNGKFEIKVSENSSATKLVISLLGYKSDTLVITATQTNYPVFLSLSQNALNELVVTGVSRTTLIRENSISILAISPKAIEQSSESNIIDVLVKNAPGLNTVKTGPNISKPFIRGLGYNRVLTLYNGIRQEGQQWGDEHGIEVDAYSIYRVEVIKGPASLMFGSDALAGVVSLIPFMPLDTDKIIHAKFISEYQSNNGLFGNGIRFTYANAHWSYALRGSYRIAKNYTNSVDGRVYNSGFQETNVSASLKHSTSKGFSTLDVTLYDNLQGIPDGSRDSLSRKFTKQIFEGSSDDIKNRPIVSPNELNSYRLSPLHQRIQHYRIYNNNHYEFGKGDVDFLLAAQQNIRREYNHPTAPAQAGMFVQLNTVNYSLRYTAPKIINNEISYAHPQLYPKGNTAATIVLSNSLLNMNLRLSL